MGCRTQGQRRGRDMFTFRTPSYRYKAEPSHKRSEDKDTVSGTVVGIEHDPVRSAPTALAKFEDEQHMIFAPEDISVGEEFQTGVSAEIKPGSTLPPAEIPEDAPVCNVEHQSGDGGKLARASGVGAQLLSHDRKIAIVKLPPGEVKHLNLNCRATIGVAAGGGRTEKPFVKVGKKYHKMKARGIKWPCACGVATSAVDYPFGDGGWQYSGQPESVSRNVPSGRKVGDIASKRTGCGGKGGK